MAIITSYPLEIPEAGDYLVGSKINATASRNPTKNFTVQAVVEKGLGVIPSYQDNAVALAGGLVAGQLYQTDGLGAAPLNAAGIVMIVQ